MSFSLKWLVTLTLLTGVWLYAFMHPRDYWVMVVFSVVFVASTIGLTLAITSRKHRAFWTGFTVATLFYGLLTLPPFAFHTIRNWFPTDIPLHWYAVYFDEETRAEENRRWDTRAGQGEAAPDITSETWARIDNHDVYPTRMDVIPAVPGQGQPTYIYYNPTACYFIGHAWFALLFGALCGSLAAWVRRREDRVAM